ncbi:MAG: hypothetical protein AAGA59_13760 [Actinomycetota bacterium]
MSDSAALKPWSVRAVNLPEHADNPIHTDVGAKAAGYPAAIVAGTTVYAYLTHPPAAAWGARWVTGGGGELRLTRAVLDDDLVHCSPVGPGAGPIGGADDRIEARVDGEVKATLDLWSDRAAPAMRPGDDLPDLELDLTEELGHYGLRAGDDIDLYRTDDGLAHPALWPTLANRVFTAHLITGSWIHTRSRIFHQGPARLGQRLTIHATVIDRFETRAGKRAVVDVAVMADGRPVARIEHEALTELTEGA